MRGFVIVLIGALLVLLRPSIMTAAFFVLCLQFGELAHPTGNLELVVGVPYFWKPLFLALTCIVTGAGPAVAAIFCMRFPSGEPLPSWRPVEKAMIAVGVFTILDYFFALVAGSTYTPLGNALYRVFSVASWLQLRGRDGVVPGALSQRVGRRPRPAALGRDRPGQLPGELRAVLDLAERAERARRARARGRSSSTCCR